MPSGGTGVGEAPDGDAAELEDVLAHGGWLLVDPRPTARAHPDTFEMPTPEELAALDRGSSVRAVFALTDLCDPVRDEQPSYEAEGRPRLTVVRERMWLVVVGREDDVLRCVLDNQPFAAYTRLTVGVEVMLPTTHVIATDPGPDDLEAYLRRNRELDLPALPESETTRPEDPTRWPTVRSDQSEVCRRAGVWPTPPWPVSRLLVAADLGPDREPLHGARFPADPERGDCGWAVFAGYDSLDEVQDGPGFEVVTVQDAARRDRRILPYLALPEGWGFTTGSAGDDVYPAQITD